MVDYSQHLIFGQFLRSNWRYAPESRLRRMDQKDTSSVVVAMSENLCVSLLVSFPFIFFENENSFSLGVRSFPARKEAKVWH
jgi:hypothetical protein